MYVCGECGERFAAPGTCPKDRQTLAAADDSLLGLSVGRYRLARSIAVGGMGRVYLGVQPEIGGRVAIKVLSEKCAADPELVDRFFAEARAVNLISHENIVKVVDMATLEDGRPYIVMEFIDGPTLTRAARGGRAPLGGVVRVFSDVLSAIGAAHAIGIVHRDLKPDNVIVTSKGHAKVLDFGIAKLAPQHQTTTAALTMTGALLGTPAYMAPEQISGARDVDARADLYAVGAVMFYAVTGRPPFAGATMFDIMRAQLEEQPPSPRMLRPDLPVSMEQVIVRALAKDPAMRWPSAVAMAAALDDAANDVPDDQWFDLSKGAPMRTRGSGPRISPTTPPPIRRDTPPAMSIVRPPKRSRATLVLGTAAALACRMAAFVVVLAIRSPKPAAAPVQAAADPSGLPINIDAAIAIAPDAAAVVQAEAMESAPSAAAPSKRPPRDSPWVVQKQGAVETMTARDPDDKAGTLAAEVARVRGEKEKPRTGPDDINDEDPLAIPTAKLAEVPTQANAYRANVRTRMQHDIRIANEWRAASALVNRIPGVTRLGLLEIRATKISSAGQISLPEGSALEFRIRIDETAAGCVAVVRRTINARTMHVENGECQPGHDVLPPSCPVHEMVYTTLRKKDISVDTMIWKGHWYGYLGTEFKVRVPDGC